jgi:hypothetical protein
MRGLIITQKDKMKKEYLILGIGIMVFITVLTLFLTPQKPIKPYFTKEPSSWIEEDRATNKKDFIINIKKATEDNSLIFSNQQDYQVNDDLISFFHYGYYKGFFFRNVYSDKEITSETELREYAKIIISNRLVPNDGIIEAYVLAKRNGNNFEFFIFVDEDWKNQLAYTNIVWGNDFSDKNTLNLFPFDFSTSKEGIYIMKINGDLNWFELNPRTGGIMVGEVNLDTPLKKTSEINSTFIYVR